jgi:NAD(P)-dependent dehydrogenase (short-subunit alcohol dehydrogenase family)
MVDPAQPYWPVIGHAALVTGAGSGICLELARLLLAQGCNVLIADVALRPESQALVDTTVNKTPRAIFHPTDVTIWAQLEAAIAACLHQFGRMDIVCPGAGVFEPTWSNFWEPPGTAESKDDLAANRYRVLDIDLTHPIRLTQLALAHFISHNVRGRVLHITSIAAQAPTFITPMYCASKAAISSFVRSLASLDAEFGIRVNGVAPGVVWTPLWSDPLHKDKLKMIDESKDQWVMPEEVAAAMIKLLEDEDMTGGVILEVGLGSMRKVEVRNDPGPSGPGLGVSAGKDCRDEILERLKRGDWGAIPS